MTFMINFKFFLTFIEKLVKKADQLIILDDHNDDNDHIGPQIGFYLNLLWRN